mmetsp:Transcript_29707/g.49234  ORF Transcript_29707/g.49234 Transcript_29707/m.49234 type:complete len:103 (-) Transcript_29707:365-673(-)
MESSTELVDVGVAGPLKHIESWAFMKFSKLWGLEFTGTKMETSVSNSSVEQGNAPAVQQKEAAVAGNCAFDLEPKQLLMWSSDPTGSNSEGSWNGSATGSPI